MRGNAIRCIRRSHPPQHDPVSLKLNYLLDAIARRGRTEREKNPTILLASHYRMGLVAHAGSPVFK